MQNAECRILHPKSKIQNPKLSQPVPQNYLDGPLGALGNKTSFDYCLAVIDPQRKAMGYSDGIVIK
jgi:hypothetical protein